MLNTHTFLTVENIDVTDQNNFSDLNIMGKFSSDILQKVIIQLQQNGVKCAEIKPGNFCVSCGCKVNNTRVCIIVYYPHKHKDIVVLPVACENEFSTWRYIFKFPKDEERFSGKELDGFVLAVDKAIQHIDEITACEWMDKKTFWNRLEYPEGKKWVTYRSNDKRLRGLHG